MTTTRKNINRIENQQQHQNEQQYNQNHHDDNYNNIIITTRTQACSENEMPGAEIMEKIAEAYRANINPMITQAAAQVIERALKNGMEPATVILAITETGMAPRPSPYYLQAVLRNWAESGVVYSKHQMKMVGTTDAKCWWKG